MRFIQQRDSNKKQQKIFIFEYLPEWKQQAL